MKNTITYERHWFGEYSLGNKIYHFYVRINMGRNLTFTCTNQDFNDFTEIYEKQNYEFDLKKDEVHI